MLMTWPDPSPSMVEDIGCPICGRWLDLYPAATRAHLIEQAEGLPVPPTLRVLLGDVVTYP
jgi:hypothetical protein